MTELKLNIPQSFFEEEIREGYTVSTQMKKVWAVQLDLLAEFQRVCDKLSINYIASGGTMLGAARHGGFIPWDDDVDLMMLREDYEKLLAYGNEFAHPYFLQTWTNDKGFFRCFARLRNSNTTAIQNMELYCGFKYNQGIFIDIFPMDSLTDDKALLEIQSKKAKKILRKALFQSSFQSRYYKDKNIVKSLQRNLIKFFCSRFMNDEKTLKQYEDICKQYNNTNTEKVSLLSFQFGNRVHDIPRNDLREIVELDFEMLKIKVPKNYKEELTWKYGEWQVPSKSPSYHGELFFDTDKSYLEYIK